VRTAAGLPAKAGSELRWNKTTTATVSKSPGRDAAGAGALLIATILACAGVGFGVGAVVGAPAALGIAGGFVGVGAGFWVVYRKFRDL
jgi:hypothetical protein